MKLKNALLSGVLAAVCCFGLTGCGKKAAIGNTAEEITFQTGDKIAEITIENYGTITAKLFPEVAPTAVKNFELLAEKGYYEGLKIHRVAKDMCIQGGSLHGDGTGGTALVDESGIFPIETGTEARNFYGALGYAADETGSNDVQFYIVNNKKPIDITQYSADLIRNEASTVAEQEEGLDDTDPVLDQLKYQESCLTNLADMIGGASDEVKKKYAEKGGYPLWDGSYTVFGQVYEGFDVLDKLSSVEVVTNKDGELSRPKTDIIIESVKITEYVEPEPESEEESAASSK